MAEKEVDYKAKCEELEKQIAALRQKHNKEMDQFADLALQLQVNLKMARVQ